MIATAADPASAHDTSTSCQRNKAPCFRVSASIQTPTTASALQRDEGSVGEAADSLEHPERPGSPRQQVHPTVLHPLEHAVDLVRTADLAQAVVEEPDDAELAFGPQALVSSSS